MSYLYVVSAAGYLDIRLEQIAEIFNCELFNNFPSSPLTSPFAIRSIYKKLSTTTKYKKPLVIFEASRWLLAR